MIYIPKRKRRLKQFSKLFLYSSTLLAVTGSYSSPIVTVLADKEISSNFENDSKINDQKQNVANSTNKNQPQKLNLSSKNNSQETQINPRASKTYQIHLVIIKTPETTQVDAPASDQNLTLITSKQAGEDITSEIDQILTRELPGKYIRAHLESLSNTVTVPDSGSEIKVYVVLQKQTIHFIGTNEAGQQLYFDEAQFQPIIFSKYMTVGDKIMEGTKLNDLINNTGANHFRLKSGFLCTNAVISNPDNHKITLEKDHPEILEFVDSDDDYNTVSSISVRGWPNDTINITNLIPNGYELVNPSNSTFTFCSAPNQKSDIVIKKKLNLNVTNSVEFIDTDDANKVIASGQSINGIKGEPITKDKIDPILEAKLGNDYQFINNTFPTVNYGDDGKSVQFKVEKKSIDNTIIYQDHGVEISRKKVNGKIGKEISNTIISDNLPTSTSHYPWELVNKTISFNFDSTITTHNVAITRKYTNKIKFCYNNNPILDNNGQPIFQNISGYPDDPILRNQINQNLIPVNYHLPNIFPNLKIINLDDSILTLNLELTPVTSIVNYLNYVDENDHPVGPQDTIQITGQEGDSITEQSLINKNPDPAHYELDPTKTQPSLIGPNNNKLKVILRGKEKKYKFIYQNEAGNQIANVENIDGRYNNSASNQIKAHIPNGYNLVNENVINSLKFGDNNEIIILIKAPTTPITTHNYINYVDENDHPVGPQDTIQITGQVGESINEYNLIRNNPDPAHYELDPSKSQPSLIGNNGSKLKVHLRGREYKYQLIYQQTATEVYRVNNVSGRYGHLVGNLITQNLPNNYTLVNSNLVNTLKFGSDSKIIIPVNTTFLPNDPGNQPIRNYLQFTLDELYFGDKITVWGDYGNIIDLKKYLPTGYELKDPSDLDDRFKIAETIHYIPIKKITIPKPELPYNFFQFIVNGKNFGDQIKVNGTAGSIFDLRKILPNDYELSSEINPLFTLGASGTVNYIPLEKITKPQSNPVNNYVQFILDGVAFNFKEKVTGKLNDVINYQSLVPQGYELEYPQQIIKIAAEGTIHKLSIRKIQSPVVNPEINYVQFIVNGDKLGDRRTVKGLLGDIIDLKVLIPKGYELVQSNETLSFGLSGTTHFVNLQKVVPPMPQTVNNYLQFTINGKNYGIAIKRTGKIGEFIQISPWIPQGYHLKITNPIIFDSEGKVHHLALVKNSSKNLITNYLQFTLFGQKLGDPIKIKGYLNDEIQIQKLVPKGFVLYDPQIKIKINPDQNLQQIPLKVLTNLTHPSKIHYHKPHLRVNTVSKHNSLPQLGEKKSKTLSLGLISLSSAGATAAWLSRRKKKEN